MGFELKSSRYIGLAVGLLIFGSASATAAPFSLIYETDFDQNGAGELAIGAYATLSDIVNDNAVFQNSVINVSQQYSVAGFAYDGQYHLLYETDFDQDTPSELVIGTYATLGDVLNDNAVFQSSAINVSQQYSVAGFTYDGQYHLLYETDIDQNGAGELAIGTYATLDDIVNDNAVFQNSVINVSQQYSVAGFAYDGLYHLLYETDFDQDAPGELAIGTYATLDDIVSDNAVFQNSVINVSQQYSVAGFESGPLTGFPQPPTEIPEPSTLALFGLGLLGLGLTRRRKAA